MWCRMFSDLKYIGQKIIHVVALMVLISLPIWVIRYDVLVLKNNIPSNLLLNIWSSVYFSRRCYVTAISVTKVSNTVKRFILSLPFLHVC